MDTIDFDALLTRIQTTDVSSEEHVQMMWNSIMDDLVSGDNRSWRDCRKPHGIVFLVGAMTST
jgi:hypothetical protein